MQIQSLANTKPTVGNKTQISNPIKFKGTAEGSGSNIIFTNEMKTVSKEKPLKNLIIDYFNLNLKNKIETAKKIFNKLISPLKKL